MKRPEGGRGHTEHHLSTEGNGTGSGWRKSAGRDRSPFMTHASLWVVIVKHAEGRENVVRGGRCVRMKRWPKKARRTPTERGLRAASHTRGRGERAWRACTMGSQGSRKRGGREPKTEKRTNGKGSRDRRPEANRCALYYSKISINRNRSY